MENEAPKVYEIPAANLPTLLEKIAKLNKTAAKLGCEPIGLTKTGPRIVEMWKTNPDGSETKVVREMFDVTVTGTAPKLAGWEFTGRIETENGLTLMYPAPGKSIPVEYREKPHWCDHCQTVRNRANTYVVTSEAGETKRVGSNCLTDFLGHKNPESIANLMQYIRELMDGFERGEYSGGGWSDPMYKLETLIPQLAAIVRVKGWVTQKQINTAIETYGYSKLQSTRQLLLDILNPFQWKAEGNELKRILELCAACKPIEADAATLEPVKKWIADKPGDTDFEYNLRQLVKLDAAPIKQWGLLAAAVGMWAKDNGKLAERAARLNEYVPGVSAGDKITIELTLTGVNVFSGNYGDTTLHRFKDADGRTVVWFSSKGKICNEGEKVKLKATVKKLEMYNDLKQTIITRAKEVA